MGSPRTPSSRTVVDAANGLARRWLQPIIQDAVEDAIRETHHEADGSDSSSRRLPVMAILVLGVVAGAFLVRRRRRDADLEQQIEKAPGTEESPGVEDEEAVSSTD